MKRGVPLRRITPLRRRKRLNPQSPKARRIAAERRKRWLDETYISCEFPGCSEQSVDWHERLPRSQGGSPISEANAVYLCRWHHDWVHEYPKAAAALGLRRWSWEGESDG